MFSELGKRNVRFTFFTSNGYIRRRSVRVFCKHGFWCIYKDINIFCNQVFLSWNTMKLKFTVYNSM